MEDQKSFGKDELTRNLIRKAGVQEPSWDFTSRIMNTILLSKNSDVFLYKPIISKKGWLWIGLSVILFCLFLAYFPFKSSGLSPENIPLFSLFKSLYESTAPDFKPSAFNLRSLQGIVAAIAAGWLLFGFDSVLRGVKKTSL